MRFREIVEIGLGKSQLIENMLDNNNIIIIVYFRREGTTYILSIVRTKETKQ